MEIAEYERLFQVEPIHWWYRALHNCILASLIESVPQRSRILDAGCGTGFLLDRMCAKYLTYGIDLSESAIQFCAKRGLTRIARATILKTPFASESFDAIVSADVLYHKNVLEDRTALIEFHRILKPEGPLIMNLPAFEFLRSTHDRVIHTKRRYTKSQLCSMLESSGFAIHKLYYRNNFLFPLISVMRILKKGKEGRTSASDVVMPPKIVNEVLFKVLTLDDWLAKKIPFPAGVSLLCIARKRIV